MTSKKIIGLCCTVLFGMLVLQCDKKTSEVILIGEEIVEEPVGELIDRNDIPPPPSEPWWTITPTELTACQLELWVYLNKFYPIHDDVNPEYQIYTIKNQPDIQQYADEVIAMYASFFNEDFPEDYLFNPEYNCPEELTVEFFEGALGAPTCMAHNYIDNVITYFYYTKLRFRYGPCPYTLHKGEEVGSHCGGFQIQYCAKLQAIFSMETGELVYLDFMKS